MDMPLQHIRVEVVVPSQARSSVLLARVRDALVARFPGVDLNVVEASAPPVFINVNRECDAERRHEVVLDVEEIVMTETLRVLEEHLPGDYSI